MIRFETGVAVKLKNIAAISSGVTFRSRIAPSPRGNVRIIQMKDLDEDNSVRIETLTRIEHAPPKPSQLAKARDIIFRSRGKTNTAALLQADAENTIVAAPLFRVRADTRKVVPEFLLWWINQPSSQAYLFSRLEGTMIQMVSKQDFEELEVILPSLQQQQKIAQFFSLSTQEQCLLEKIRNCKAAYTQRILMQMVANSPSREPVPSTTPSMAAAHHHQKITNKEIIKKEK